MFESGRGFNGKNYWGLTVQRGPWQETPQDVLNRTATKDGFTGVPDGETYTPNKQVILGQRQGEVLPPMPGPSQYSQQEIVDRYFSSQKDAAGYQNLLASLFAQSMKNSMKPDQVIDPNVWWHKKLLKRDAKRIQNLNVIPQAGAFERDLEVMGILDNDRPDEKSATESQLDNMMDMLDTGVYSPSSVRRRVPAKDYENFLTLSHEYYGEVPTFKPPRSPLESQQIDLGSHSPTGLSPLFSNMGI
jgi:hypothetical protein